MPLSWYFRAQPSLLRSSYPKRMIRRSKKQQMTTMMTINPNSLSLKKFQPENLKFLSMMFLLWSSRQWMFSRGWILARPWIWEWCRIIWIQCPRWQLHPNFLLHSLTFIVTLKTNFPLKFTDSTKTTTTTKITLSWIRKVCKRRRNGTWARQVAYVWKWMNTFKRPTLVNRWWRWWRRWKRWQNPEEGPTFIRLGLLIPNYDITYIFLKAGVFLINYVLIKNIF